MLTFLTELGTLILHRFKWDARQLLSLKITLFLCLKRLEKPVSALPLPCKHCRERVPLSWAPAAVPGGYCTAHVLSAFPLSYLSGSARMISSPLLQIVPLLCRCRICGGLMGNVLWILCCAIPVQGVEYTQQIWRGPGVSTAAWMLCTCFCRT